MSPNDGHSVVLIYIVALSLTTGVKLPLKKIRTFVVRTCRGVAVGMRLFVLCPIAVNSLAWSMSTV